MSWTARGALCLLLVGGFIGYRRVMRLIAPPKAPLVSFHLANGDETTLVDSARPTVVGFIIQPCGYSDRVLEALQQIRQRHSEDVVWVVAFYLNPTTDAALTQLQSAKQLDFPLAAAQQTQGLMASLAQSFEIHGAGVDVYVVKPGTGKIQWVDFSAKGPAEELREKVETLIAATR